MVESKRRARGEGGLYQRADGLWVGAVQIPTEDGKRRRAVTTSMDYETAVDNLRKLRHKIDDGFIPVSGKTTVAKWCEKWLSEIRGPNVDPGTLTFYEKNVRLYIVPEVGSRRLDRLTPEHVRVMTRRLQDRVSNRAAQNAWRVLRMALKDAMKEGLLVRNVVEATYKPKHTPEEGKSLTLAQAKTVINLADSSRDETWAVRVATAFYCGPRPAELLGLRWSSVDLTKGEMRLEWQLQRLSKDHGCVEPCGRTKPGFCPDAKWRVPPGFEMQPCTGSLAFTRPKTRKGVRVIPLLEPWRLLLVSLKSNTGPNPHDLVFHHPDGKPISPEQDWKQWDTLFKTAKIDAHRYTSRHTTATLLQGFGVDEDTRMAIMGQSALAAHRAYVHVDQTQTRKALARLNELLPTVQVTGR